MKLNATNKILIIQPEDPVREMLVEVFKKNNFEVLEAVDGADGFSKANNETGINVVLTALNMPRIDGREFLERKKNNEFLKDVPVVIYDNIASEEERQELLSLGAKDFLAKGTVSPDKLIQHIARAMQKGDYFFQIDPYALDAQQFVEDQHLPQNFKCTNCGADLAVKITIGDNKSMQTGIECPQCGTQYL